MYLLAIIGLLSSVVSAFYYLRIIKIMYFDKEIEKFDDMSGLGIKIFGFLDFDNSILFRSSIVLLNLTDIASKVFINKSRISYLDKVKITNNFSMNLVKNISVKGIES